MVRAIEPISEVKEESMPEEKKDQKEQSISISTLKEILAEQARVNQENTQKLIEELRKPTVLEQKKLEAEAKALADANQERADNATAMLLKITTKRTEQAICSHKHRNGHSHCVYIMEKAPSPGYILCQLNQCKIRPGVAPVDYKGTDIYDTALFNRLFQELPSNEMFQ
jgi:hypothetical protein